MSTSKSSLLLAGQMSFRKFPFEFITWVVHVRARSTLVSGGITGGSPMVLHSRVENLVSGRDGKTGSKVTDQQKRKRFVQNRTNLSCLLICPAPAALACILTSALNEFTSSTINFFIPSIVSSSSNPKSNFCVQSWITLKS
jgi:hypothetical protein